MLPVFSPIISLQEGNDQHCVENVQIDQHFDCRIEVVENDEMDEQSVINEERVNPSQYSQASVNNNSTVLCCVILFFISFAVSHPSHHPINISSSLYQTTSHQTSSSHHQSSYLFTYSLPVDDSLPHLCLCLYLKGKL